MDAIEPVAAPEVFESLKSLRKLPLTPAADDATGDASPAAAGDVAGAAASGRAALWAVVLELAKQPQAGAAAAHRLDEKALAGCWSSAAAKLDEADSEDLSSSEDEEEAAEVAAAEAATKAKMGGLGFKLNLGGVKANEVDDKKPEAVPHTPKGAIVEQLQGDPRTVDKLVDGVNSTYDDRHMWLAPFR